AVLSFIPHSEGAWLRLYCIRFTVTWVAMRGRFTLRTPMRDIVDVFDLANAVDWQPRFTIAPTQQAAAHSLSSVPVNYRFQFRDTSNYREKMQVYELACNGIPKV